MPARWQAILDVGQQRSITNPAQERRPPHNTGIRSVRGDVTTGVLGYLIQPAKRNPPEKQFPPHLQPQLVEFRLLQPGPITAVYVESVPNLQGGIHLAADAN